MLTHSYLRAYRAKRPIWLRLQLLCFATSEWSRESGENVCYRNIDDRIAARRSKWEWVEPSLRPSTRNNRIGVRGLEALSVAIIESNLMRQCSTTEREVSHALELWV